MSKKVYDGEEIDWKAALKPYQDSFMPKKMKKPEVDKEELKKLTRLMYDSVDSFIEEVEKQKIYTRNY